MRESSPLQKDISFEKLIFRQDEELSKRIFDKMRGGELVYPHEGLKSIFGIIDEIKATTIFSEGALRYAVARSHEYSLKEMPKVKRKLKSYSLGGQPIIIGKSSWHLSNRQKKYIDSAYAGFSLEKAYGVQPISRPAVDDHGNITGPPMYEPYMMFSEEDSCPGKIDYKPRKMEEANMWLEESMWMMKTLLTKSAADFG